MSPRFRPRTGIVDAERELSATLHLLSLFVRDYYPMTPPCASIVAPLPALSSGTRAFETRRKCLPRHHGVRMVVQAHKSKQPRVFSEKKPSSSSCLPATMLRRLVLSYVAARGFSSLAAPALCAAYGGGGNGSGNFFHGGGGGNGDYVGGLGALPAYARDDESTKRWRRPCMTRWRRWRQR